MQIIDKIYIVRQGAAHETLNLETKKHSTEY